jgi:hypothetical protein
MEEEKVTSMPGQMGFMEGVIKIPAATGGSTFMVMGIELTGFPKGQVALEVSWQSTTSPFAGVYV